jgi:hypothetical protein
MRTQPVANITIRCANPFASNSSVEVKEMKNREPPLVHKRNPRRLARALLLGLSALGLAIQLPMNASAADAEPHFFGFGCDDPPQNNSTGMTCHLHLVYEQYAVPIVLPDDLPCKHEGGTHVHCDPGPPICPTMGPPICRP